VVHIQLDGKSLTIELLFSAATQPSRISLAASSKKLMQRSRALVEEWLAKKESIYGVTTGFGEFSNVHVPFEKLEELQHNLIVSHAAGTGEPLPPEPEVLTAAARRTLRQKFLQADNEPT